MQGGVEIHRAHEPFHADGKRYPAGSDIILMAQPFRVREDTARASGLCDARRIARWGRSTTALRRGRMDTARPDGYRRPYD